MYTQTKGDTNMNKIWHISSVYGGYIIHGRYGSKTYINMTMLDAASRYIKNR